MGFIKRDLKQCEQVERVFRSVVSCNIRGVCIRILRVIQLASLILRLNQKHWTMDLICNNAKNRCSKGLGAFREEPSAKRETLTVFRVAWL